MMKLMELEKQKQYKYLMILQAHLLSGYQIKEKFRYFQTHKREIFTDILNIHIYKISKINWF